MVVKSHGKMKRARKKVRSEGIESITRYIAEFKSGDNVLVRIEPSSAFPTTRFNNKIGMVVRKSGRAYVVRIKNMGVEREITLNPENIRAVNKS